LCIFSIKYDNAPGIKTQEFWYPNRVANEIPNTTWSQLRACGAYFDENEEYTRAFKCASPVLKEEYDKELSMSLNPPRCFVIPWDAPDVQFVLTYKTNAIIHVMFGEIYIILGFYLNSSDTIFLVENYDIAEIYRHELQHYFIDSLNLDRKLNNEHAGTIWEKCEPKEHTTSQAQSDLIDSILKLEHMQVK
jgi:hypothetical protein